MAAGGFVCHIHRIHPAEHRGHLCSNRGTVCGVATRHSPQLAVEGCGEQPPTDGVVLKEPRGRCFRTKCYPEREWGVKVGDDNSSPCLVLPLYDYTLPLSCDPVGVIQPASPFRLLI